MRIHLALPVVAVSLASCGQPTPSAAPAAVATSPAKAMSPRLPGEWEYTMQASLVDVQGLPADTATKMMAMTPPPQIHRECLARPEPRTDVDKIFGASGNGCVLTKAPAPAGKIAGTVVCTQPGGGKGTGTINGTIEPATFSITMNLSTDMPLPGTPGTAASMKMVMEMSGKRVGDCPG